MSALVFVLGPPTLAWTGNFSLTIVIAVDGIDSELRCGRLSLSLSKRLPGREEAKPARRCPRRSARREWRGLRTLPSWFPCAVAAVDVDVGLGSVQLGGCNTWKFQSPSLCFRRAVRGSFKQRSPGAACVLRRGSRA